MTGITTASGYLWTGEKNRSETGRNINELSDCVSHNDRKIMMIAWLLYIPVDVFILSICANHMCYNSLFTIAIIFKTIVITLTNDLFFINTCCNLHF